jgi:hypothetical protein
MVQVKDDIGNSLSGCFGSYKAINMIEQQKEIEALQAENKKQNEIIYKKLNK